MKIDITKPLSKITSNIKHVASELQTTEQVISKETSSKALDCTSASGKAFVALQNEVSEPTSKEYTLKILTDIAEKHNLNLGFYRGDKFIAFGKPFNGFKDLYSEDMRARCLRDKNGAITEILVKDNNKGDVFIYNTLGTIVKHFTTEDMKALKEYKYYPIDIHTILRKEKNFLSSDKNTITDIIKTIDNIFQDSKKVERNTSTMFVFRALQDSLSEEQIKNLSKIGGIFEEKSFVSTTRELNTAKRFNHHGTPILKIELPPNSKHLDLDKIFNIDTTHWREQEILLNRNSKFVVKNFDTQNNIIEVKYINE